MSSSNFPTDPRAALTGDASVVINLIATGCAAEIIRALPNPFVVTDNACAELKDGARKGHDDHERLMRLTDAGLVNLVSLGPSGLSVYESLIDGSNLSTLDDGEAATIAYAHETAGVALLDERKARSLCAGAFPGLRIISTVEILMDSVLTRALGLQGQADAIVNALKIGRMRVPLERVSELRALVGEDRAAQCKSLPKSKPTRPT
jgi:predicted nucleic acid-binding protein